MEKEVLNDPFQEAFETTKFGFTTYSEKINGRIAMIGFTLSLLVELITKKNLVHFFF